jgi:hypothetical protein
MLGSFRQHACSCCVHFHKPENASYRDAKRRRTIETRHEGPEGALLFLRATIKHGKRRKQVPQRGTILAFPYVESGNLYRATQSQLCTDSTLPFESRFSTPSLSNRSTRVLTSLFTPQTWILLLLVVTEPFEEKHRGILERRRPMYITGNLYTFHTRESSFELELAVTAAQPVHMKIPVYYALVLEEDAYPNAHYLQTEQPASENCAPDLTMLLHRFMLTRMMYLDIPSQTPCVIVKKFTLPLQVDLHRPNP